MLARYAANLAWVASVVKVRPVVLCFGRITKQGQGRTPDPDVARGSTGISFSFQRCVWNIGPDFGVRSPA